MQKFHWQLVEKRGDDILQGDGHDLRAGGQRSIGKKDPEKPECRITDEIE